MSLSTRMAKAGTPTPPRRIVGLSILAIVVWALTAAVFWTGLHQVYLINREKTAMMPIIIGLIGLTMAYPLLPWARSVGQGARRARALAASDLRGARASAASGRDDALTSLGFSAGFLIVGALLTFVTTNDAAVTKTFLRADFIAQSWSKVAEGFWINVQVAVGAEIIVLVAGLGVAIMRMLPGRPGRPLRWLATIYVDVFRAVPSIIVLYLVGFGLTIAKVPIVSELSPTMLAIIALALTYTGYVAEVYRAGLESIHPSQWSAARSLGLSYGQTLRKVIVPQATRRMVPPLLNDFIGLQKDTALISIMGVVDSFMQARLISSSVFNLSPVLVVAVVFIIATIPQARFVDRLMARDAAKMKAGAL
ncbi:amino acid ABC transporter membrane protein (PAAT family) [Brevibacterium sanguinis]|uniref:Amino acid ABC transporter membrane protein (PAAT family) n=3 Tax=Brevibacteriaceae TaxID=85019 RepID=A0A366INR1_9MICO|nr:amino acid ABC transporter membrane protein (PAAT family) [Brevibacterium sanguinis]RBP74705.1 amino acid ABC transporter membrane protein (PAAT family) [Brevibacterium celere]